MLKRNRLKQTQSSKERRVSFVAAKLGVVTSATDIKRCAERSRKPFTPDDILAGES
jgi:hypothetical protein